MYTDDSPRKSLFRLSAESNLERHDYEKNALLPEERSNVEDSPFTEAELGRRKCRCSTRSITVLNILLFAASVTLFLSVPFRRDTSLNADLKRVSAYSPVLETGHIPLVDTQVSGNLFPARDSFQDGLGRHEPGPATDAQWADWEYQRKFAVSSATLRRMGMDPATTVKYPADYGLGDDAYMVALDAFHQIHCLNMLRKEAFRDYYFDGERHRDPDLYAAAGKSPPQHDRVRPEFHWIHLRHCTDILLQTLQCHADTDVLPMTWLETQANPWPQFSIQKKCKSFDALVDWRDRHAEPWSKISALVKPRDLVPVDEQYAELFGNATSEGDNTHHPLW